MAQQQLSLEEIFGTPQQPAIGGSRPSLDSILGVGSATPEKSFTEKVTEDLKKRGENILENTDQLQDEGVKRLPETVLRNAGQVAGGVLDILGNAISSATPQPVKDKVMSIFQTPEGQKAVESLGKGLESYNAWAKENPNLSKDIESVFNISQVIPLVKGVGMATDVAVDTTKAGLNLTRKARDLTTGMVTDTYKKGKDILKGVDSDTLVTTLSDPELQPFLTASVDNTKKISEALKQGFEPKEVKFLATVEEADKPAIRQMKELAEKAETNLREQKRPIDIVGDNGIRTLRKIQDLNQTAGADVDRIARALAGTKVDATQVGVTAKTALEKAGVTIRNPQEYADAVAKAVIDGKPTPSRFNYDTSVFKKLPAIQKQLNNALSDLPEGPMDAYDLHKFKKSIDQIVEYGKSSDKPLTREAENVLKEIRASADDTLDSNFSAYNKANTDFKVTRDLLDEAHSIVGKKTDFLTANANLDFGQAMRSLFSNNKTRGRLTSFLQNLQTTADRYGVATKENLIDQAIYTQILEKVYGTQAVTGLQGEMTKAIRKGMEAFRNPIDAIGDLAVDKAQKLQGITPEAKKAVLDLFTK